MLCLTPSDMDLYWGLNIALTAHEETLLSLVLKVCFLEQGLLSCFPHRSIAGVKKWGTGSTASSSEPLSEHDCI